MRGKTHRRSIGFHQGHEAAFKRSVNIVDQSDNPPSKFIRLSNEDFILNTDQMPTGSIHVRDAAGICTGAKLLRPRSGEVSFFTQSGVSAKDRHITTNILVHKEKTAELWNFSFKAHKLRNPKCDGDLKWDKDQCKQWGMSWVMALMCTECTYISSPKRLYEEVVTGKKGRRAAAPNIGIQVGLARQGISNSGLADILSATDTVPPSLPGMQKSANKVNSLIIKEGRKDLKHQINHLRDINKLKGLPENSPINIEGDCTYNNRLCSGVGKTPMQPATQATYITAENVTKAKKIIAVKTNNKLCVCKRNGKNEQHQNGCSANLEPSAVIGNEGNYLKECISDINDGGLMVQHVTLDGDSNAASAASEVKQPDKNIELKVLRCSRHLTRNLEKEVTKQNFSNHMFFGGTGIKKDQARNRFALDLGDRCQAEFERAFAENRNDLLALKNKVSYVPDAILNCYQGDCTLCKKHSFVCHGGKFSWPRPYLNTCEAYKGLKCFISPTEDDLNSLRKIINMRLGVKAMKQTYLNTNQNKCEATNRGLVKAIPKHITFARNYPGRVHAAVHSMNNGPGVSLIRLCKAAGAPINLKSCVVNILQKKDHIVTKNKLRQISYEYKLRRSINRQRKYKMYDAKKAAECYHKGRGSKSDTKKAVPITEHSYAVRTKKKIPPPS